jgi:hypothetical protein
MLKKNEKNIKHPKKFYKTPLDKNEKNIEDTPNKILIGGFHEKGSAYCYPCNLGSGYDGLSQY